MMPELVVSGEGPRPFKCLHCPENFKWGSELQEHMTSAHPPDIKIIPELKYKSSKPNHIFPCPHCPQSFFTNFSLNDHVNNDHIDSNLYNCEIEGCCYSSNSRKNFDTHLKTHSDEKPFSCDNCSNKYKHKKDLRKHLEHKHLNPDSRLRLSCPHCPTTLFSRSLRNVHVRAVHLGKNFKCPIQDCVHCAMTQGHLDLHLLSHSNEKNYQCELCSNAYKHEKDLKKHLRTHVDPELRIKFSCEACPKTFFTKCALKEHVNGVHNNKTYKCPVKGCGHSSLAPRHLKTHMKSNSEKKEFKCGHCPNAYKHNKDLKKHVKNCHALESDELEVRSVAYMEEEFKMEFKEENLDDC